MNGATPAVESVSLRLKLFNFLEGAPIVVALSNLEPPFLRLSLTLNFFKFSRGLFFSLPKRLVWRDKILERREYSSKNLENKKNHSQRKSQKGELLQI
jgi:hypothetical protein